MIEQKCKQSLDDGYQAIKLHEVENKCIEAGRKGSGNIPLMLDANCPWTYEETMSKKEFPKSMKLLWLEEPIYPPEDYETLAKLNKTPNTKIIKQKVLEQKRNVKLLK